MQLRDMSRILGAYLYILALALVVPLGVALYYQFIASPESHPQPHSTLAFLGAIAVCLGLALLFRRIGRSSKGQLYRREGLVLVVTIWFLTAGVACLPFQFSGTFSNVLDSYWEAMSGLTTTGASVMTPKKYDDEGQEVPIEHVISLTPPTVYTYYGTITPVRDAEGEIILEGIEAVSRAVLFWRSFLQWLGGMGIVVLFLAILPALGVGGKVLYQSEVPGPLKDSMTPRIRDTAGLLWKIYLVLSLSQVILLMVTNHALSLYDAVCITFSTISTGGFTVKNESIGAYQSQWTDAIVMLFMLIGSINFVHYWSLTRRKFARLWDPELFIYLLSLIGGTFVLTLLLHGTPEVLLAPTESTPENFNWWASLRFGAFQLLSVQSSTGFVTADFDMWPFATQVILLTSMFIGGMSGSTAGGMKVIRHSMIVRITLDRIESIFRPNQVRVMHMGQGRISVEKATTVLSFFFIVIALTLIGTFVLVLDGIDPETALSVNACCLNNIGVAFRMAGPTETFAFLPTLSKSVEILFMVAGRLEFFAILILFIPDFWRGR